MQISNEHASVEETINELKKIVEKSADSDARKELVAAEEQRATLVTSIQALDLMLAFMKGEVASICESMRPIKKHKPRTWCFTDTLHP